MEPLIEQNVNCLTPGAVDHEFRAGLAKRRCRVVNQLTRVRLNPQIDGAFGFTIRSSF